MVSLTEKAWEIGVMHTWTEGSGSLNHNQFHQDASTQATNTANTSIVITVTLPELLLVVPPAHSITLGLEIELLLPCNIQQGQTECQVLI